MDVHILLLQIVDELDQLMIFDFVIPYRAALWNAIRNKNPKLTRQRVSLHCKLTRCLVSLGFTSRLVSASLIAYK